MSDDPDEVGELRQGLADLREAYEELREATTARDRDEATADIKDARADLDKIAAATGVSRKAIEHAMAEAKRAERKDELRPILAELLEEMKPEEPEPKPDDDSTAPPKPPKEPPAPPVEPEPDTAPRGEHWSERRVSELLS